MKKLLPVALLSLALLLSLGSAAVYAQEPQGPGLTPSTGPGGTPSTGPGLTPGTGTGLTPATGEVKVSFGIKNPFKRGVGDSLFDLLKTIMDKIVLPLGAVLAVLAFIYAGFKYVMAQGNPKKIEEANLTLLYAAIGTAVLMGAWVLANAICKTINLLGGPVCN